MKKALLCFTFILVFTLPLYAAQTKQQRDIENCQRIGYPEWRDDCFENLAKNELTYAVCFKIINPYKRSKCFAAHPPLTQTDCALNKNVRDINSCFIQLKDSTKDLSVCKKISDLKLKKECYACSKTAKDTTVCLQFRAKQLADKTICDLIDAAPAKLACLSSLSSKTTVTGCEQPETLQEFKLCKQFEIAQKEEIKDAKKLQKNEKAQALVQQKAAKLQQIKDAKATQIQEKAKKLQQDKEAKAAKAHEKAAKTKSVKAVKVQIKTETPVVVENKNGATKDDKIIKSPETTLKMDVVAMGCTQGFGGWVVPPKNKKEEQNCDIANVQEFKSVLNHCSNDQPDPKILLYDLDYDGCVTCKDFLQWKKQIKDLYKSKKRSTDGKQLIVTECKMAK